jgi:hypothetical protein
LCVAGRAEADLGDVDRVVTVGVAQEHGCGRREHLGGQQADPLLLATVQLLKACNNLPDVRASGKCGTPVVRWAPEDDPWVVELVDALHDELVKQCGGSHTLASGT